MDTDVKHVTDRFRPLDTKKEVVEYTLDAFVNNWTSVNVESGKDQPLTVIYVNEKDVINTPFDKNLPADFELNYPEKT